ncbi:MAG: hypothetical protein GX995_02690, partial [Clostridiales bacterium]|nr:hypothetical protein [Clostridiales bacterium]
MSAGNNSYDKGNRFNTYNTKEAKELQVGFVGNPNSGKTTLFNAYTGAQLKVANWPGVTEAGIERIVVSTYQAVSGAGAAA